MPHLSSIFLLVILFAGSATAGDALYDELMADPAKAKVMRKGIKILEEYFKSDLGAMESGSKGTRALKKKDEARFDFFQWFESTRDEIGVDLRTKPNTVIEMLGVARIKSLNNKIRKGGIEYVKVGDARGMERLEYAYMLPRSYDFKGDRYPLIVTLHGRVIDQKHPAFRNKDFGERSRHVVYNHWLKTPMAAETVIIAPTSDPNGFTFTKDPYRDLQVVYRALAEAMKNFHVDWDRTFLEVQGSAIRVICEQALMFAGFIVRDRVDDRGKPLLPEEEFFMLENLNGVPLVYVADESHWARVGKPLAEALEKAYEAAGAKENLLILQAKRDQTTKALKGDPAKIHEFLKGKSRPKARQSFKWRFFSSSMKTPLPIDVTGANFIYDVGGAEHPSRKAPLKDKAGSLQMTSKDNVIDIAVTEAESLSIFLYDGLVDLDHPVTIKVNGEVVREKGKVSRDWKLFWDFVVPGRFFMLPYLAKIDVDFESKAQFEVPEEEKEAEEGAGAGADGEGGPAEKDAAVGTGK